jgi:hypothetical protein
MAECGVVVQYEVVDSRMYWLIKTRSKTYTKQKRVYYELIYYYSREQVLFKAESRAVPCQKFLVPPPLVSAIAGLVRGGKQFFVLTGAVLGTLPAYHINPALYVVHFTSIASHP